MSEVVSKEELIPVARLMVNATRRVVRPGAVVKQAAIPFKLIDDVGTARNRART